MFVATLSSAAVGLVPETASGATTVSYSPSTGLLIQGDAGANLTVVIEAFNADGDFYVVRDLSAGTNVLTAGPGCTPISQPPATTCQKTGAAVENANLAGGDDRLTACGQEFQLHDDLFVTAGKGNDTIEGGSGDDGLDGGDGDDVLIPCGGGDLITGGPGADTVDFGPTSSPTPRDVIVSLDNQANDGLFAIPGEPAQNANVMSDVEAVIGTNFDDLLKGNTQRNVLIGGAGRDTLQGGDETTSFQGQVIDRLGDTLNSRDGETDLSINCGRGIDVAIIDLRDPAPRGCESIDRAAITEGPNVRIPTGPLSVARDGSAGLRLGCPRSLHRPCRGRVSLGLFHRGANSETPGPGATNYSIRPGRSKRVEVRLRAGARHALAIKHELSGRVVSVERGLDGPKTTIRIVTLTLHDNEV